MSTDPVPALLARDPLRAVGPQVGSDTRLEEHSPHHETHSPHNSSASPKHRGVGMAESLAIGCALVVCVTAQLAPAPPGRHRHPGMGSRTCRRRRRRDRRPGPRPGAVHLFSLGRAPHVAAVSDSGPAARSRSPSPPSSSAPLVSVPLYALLRATPAWWLIAWVMFAAVTVVWQLATPFFLRAQAGPLAPAPPELTERVAGHRRAAPASTSAVASSSPASPAAGVATRTSSGSARPVAWCWSRPSPRGRPS